MKEIPKTENPLVLRTDFSDQTAWETICSIIKQPNGDFLAYVEFVDDQSYERVATDQLLKFIPKNYNHSFIIVVDKIAVSLPDYPLLVLDLHEEPEHEFRAIPSQIQAIENNLSIGNMGFEEFADGVDENGIFRGFPEN